MLPPAGLIPPERGIAKSSAGQPHFDIPLQDEKLRHRADAQLAKDLFAMVLDRMKTDIETAPDRFGRVALQD